MQTTPRAALRRRLLPLLLLGALALLLAQARPAAAAPVTWTDPGGSGASVTLSSASFRAGERIEISGSGFAGSGGVGHPLVALKPDDNDLPWSYGGPDAYDGPDDAPIWFEPGKTSPEGQFNGWIEIPAGTAVRGPGSGDHAGDHWLRILSGAFSTGSRYTVPITYQAWFAVVDRVQLGYEVASPAAWYPGSVVPATGGVLTARGAGFDASSPVAIELDGAPATATGATTDADGAFRAAVTIPNGIAAGAHTLRLSTATVSSTQAVTVVPHSATVLTPQVRPGDLVAVRVSGYVGVSGAGQQVALNLAGTVLNPSCDPVDATGSGLLTGAVPAGTAPGATALNVLAGTRCLTPPVSDPFPRPLATPGVTISATAPTVATAAIAAAGEPLAIDGEGFAAGEQVTASLDGGAVSALLTASAGGEVRGELPLPATASHGAHVLLLTGAGGDGAARRLEVVPTPTELLSTPIAEAGSDVAVTLAGWRRGDGAGGQQVAVALDDGAPLACVATDDDGDGAATVTIPAGTPAGDHQLRLTAGSACAAGETTAQRPNRAHAVQLEVTAAAQPPAPGPGDQPPPVDTPTPTPPAPRPTAPGRAKTTVPAVRALTRSGNRLVLRLRPGTAAKSTVTVRTARKLRLTAKRRAALVTLATATVRKGATVARLSLTRDGRALLRRHRAVKLVVRVSAPGAKATTKTVTLRVR